MPLIVIAACAIVLGAGDVLAQVSPFGVGSAPARPTPGGLVGFVMAEQAEFYRALSSMIRTAKADRSAVTGLLGISFAYGIFHAAGPGHGKAVISSYLIANEETWRRGVILSFASALLQSIVAVTIVGIAAALLGATRKTMCNTNHAIEIASYGLIGVIGARLLWIKGGGLIDALRSLTRELPAPVGAAVTGRRDHLHHDHGQRRRHYHDASCGHALALDPAHLAGPAGWRRGIAAIFAVGLRPCSGAILVLVFALAQGLFWAGAAATLAMGLGTAITVTVIAALAAGARTFAARFTSERTGIAWLLLRAAEVGAAALILFLGVLLLGGYLATEQLVGLC